MTSRALRKALYASSTEIFSGERMVTFWARKVSDTMNRLQVILLISSTSSSSSVPLFRENLYLAR